MIHVVPDRSGKSSGAVVKGRTRPENSSEPLFPPGEGSVLLMLVKACLSCGDLDV